MESSVTSEVFSKQPTQTRRGPGVSPRAWTFGFIGRRILLQVKGPKGLTALVAALVSHWICKKAMAKKGVLKRTQSRFIATELPKMDRSSAAQLGSLFRLFTRRVGLTTRARGRAPVCTTEPSISRLNVRMLALWSRSRSLQRNIADRLRAFGAATALASRLQPRTSSSPYGRSRPTKRAIQTPLSRAPAEYRGGVLYEYCFDQLQTS